MERRHTKWQVREETMSKLAPEGAERTTEPMVELHDILPEGAHEDPRDVEAETFFSTPFIGDPVVADAPAPAPTEEANAADSAVPEPGPGSESEGAPEAKGEEEGDAESSAAPAPPAGASLLEVCYHRGVTIEALRARGSEAAAKEKVTELKRDWTGSTPLHCLCMNVMVTLEMLRYVAELWLDAAKEKDEARARPSPRRECAPSRRVTPRSLSRFVRRITARLCTTCVRTRRRPPR